MIILLMYNLESDMLVYIFMADNSTLKHNINFSVHENLNLCQLHVSM